MGAFVDENGRKRRHGHGVMSVTRLPPIACQAEHSTTVAVHVNHKHKPMSFYIHLSSTNHFRGGWYVVSEDFKALNTTDAQSLVPCDLKTSPIPQGVRKWITNSQATSTEPAYSTEYLCPRPVR